MIKNREYKSFKSTKYKFAKILCPKCVLENSPEDDSLETKKLSIPESKSFNDRLYSSVYKRPIPDQPTELATLEIKSRLSKPLPEIPKVEKKDHSVILRTPTKTALIPDLQNIFNLPYYWGEMDRYEAEAELKETEDGTFLLRDSVQEDFMFSVSFNRFGRTIHARVECKLGHYAFNSHYGTAPSIPKLLSNYQNTQDIMFYHPLCSTPRNRRNAFTLQDLCRSVICSSLKYYEDVYELNISNYLLQKLHLSHFKIPILYSNYNNESSLTTTSSS